MMPGSDECLEAYYNDCRHDNELAAQYEQGFEACKELVLKRIEALLNRYNSVGLLDLKFDLLEDRL